MDIDLNLLREYLAEWTAGNRWIATRTNHEDRQYCRTSREAEVARRIQGENDLDRQWNNGSGGGIDPLHSGIVFAIFGMKPSPLNVIETDALAAALRSEVTRAKYR